MTSRVSACTPADNGRLLSTLERLRDLGNTVIVVEHDRATIENADWVVEFGPGAGIHGGEITFSGTPQELRYSDTITGEYINGTRAIERPGFSRLVNGQCHTAHRLQSQRSERHRGRDTPKRIRLRDGCFRSRQVFACERDAVSRPSRHPRRQTPVALRAF
ncbi:MAG: hypothetical protein U5N86_01235 [Planctomycetota bacterium]|nr:hypothetical protein [Planctomycetota bacterium]